MHIREIDRFIELRPLPVRFRSSSGIYASWGVRLSSSRLPVGRRSVAGCRICGVNGQAISPRPIPAHIDSHMFSDSSNSGAGAVISVERPEISSSPVARALQRTASPGTAHVELVKGARRKPSGQVAFSVTSPLWTRN